MNKNSQTVHESIVALEPCYGARGGNAVRIYTRDGKTRLEQRRMKSVLKAIAAGFNIDLTALRRNLHKIFGRSNSLPLTFTPDLALVPLKMRIPDYENDGATGYINYFDVTGIDEVQDVGPGQPKCHFKLQGGHTVPCFFSRENMIQRMKIAELAHERNLSRIRPVSDRESLVRMLEDISARTWGRVVEDLAAVILNDESRP